MSSLLARFQHFLEIESHQLFSKVATLLRLMIITATTNLVLRRPAAPRPLLPHPAAFPVPPPVPASAQGFLAIFP